MSFVNKIFDIFFWHLHYKRIELYSANLGENGKFDPV
jgi:hypothetical protein